jgi:hypothetical protein
MRRQGIVVATLVALALPAPALGHGRSALVASDYRITLARSSLAAQGVDVAILGGDRDLSLSVAPGVELVVRGELDEPLLRIGSGGVWVNADSPTATSDHLVSVAQHGWVRIGTGRSIVWHDDRLTPRPSSALGPDGRFAIPIDVDGRPETISGLFVRVARPALWPWIVAAVALSAGVGLAARRRPLRRRLAVGLGVSGGVAALVTVTTFAARDNPGGVGWLQLGSGLAIGAVVSVVFAALRGRSRVQAAGVIGAVAAVASLSSLSVFWHAVVISLLPATAARASCGLALVAGLGAVVLSLLREAPEARPGAAG